MKLNIKVEKEVDVAAIEISANCRDCFTAFLTNGIGDTIHEYNGYVPNFLPGQFGDSIELTIDIATGQILNWPKITKEQLENWINNVKE